MSERQYQVVVGGIDDHAVKMHVIQVFFVIAGCQRFFDQFGMVTAVPFKDDPVVFYFLQKQGNNGAFPAVYSFFPLPVTG